MSRKKNTPNKSTVLKIKIKFAELLNDVKPSNNTAKHNSDKS